MRSSVLCSFLLLGGAGAMAQTPAPIFAELGSRLPAAREPVHATKFLDVDGDLDPDLCISEQGGLCRIWRNDGRGTFDELSTFTFGTAPAADVLEGDLDRDSDVDLFLIGARSKAVYLNDGSGRFSLHPAQVPRPAEGGAVGVLGDVDGDADLDVAIANWMRVELLLNLGDGSFLEAPVANMPQLAVGAMSCTFFDRDADLDLDLYVGCTPIGFPPFVTNSGFDVLLDNDGSGRFTDASGALPYAREASWQVCSGDLDADQDLDLFVAARSSNRSYVLSKIGAVYLQTWTSSTGAERVTDAALRDVDNDGDFDAVLCTEGTPGSTEGGICVFANDGTGQLAMLQPAGTLDGTALTDLDCADVDLDGDLDVVACSYSSDLVKVSFNGGRGDLLEVRSANPSMWVASAASIDLDRDGFTDIALGAYRCFVLRDIGLATPGTQAIPAPPSASPSIHRLVSGDFDGDGDADLAFSRSGWPSLLWNDAGVLVSRLPQLPPPPSPVALADMVCSDLDLDGDVDLVLGFYGTGTWATDKVRVLENVGSGVFVTGRARLPIVGYRGPYLSIEYVRRIALLDADGDADLDMLVGMIDTPARFLLNQGNLVFVDSAAGSIPTVLGESVAKFATGDLDGDGDLDVFVAKGRSDGGIEYPQIDVLLENRSGTFVPVALPPFPATVTRDAELLDFDRDGRLDIVSSHSYGQFGTGQGFRLLRNLGGMSFADASAMMPDALGAEEMIAEDFDRDGDTDLFLAGYGSTRMWWNVERQLSLSVPARAGYTVDLQFHGPPSAAWMLLGAPAAGSLDLGVYGTLFLDPLGTSFFAAGALDAQGRGRIPGLRIPGGPANLGRSAWLQAVIDAPLRLSNPLQVRIDRY